MNNILDLARLEEAFEDDTAGIAELLDLALETGAKHTRALEAALAAGDAESMRRAAHAIKGSSGNIGANTVMHLADELEQRARVGDLSGARERVDAIGAEYARVAEAVRAYHARVG